MRSWAYATATTCTGQLHKLSHRIAHYLNYTPVDVLTPGLNGAEKPALGAYCPALPELPEVVIQRHLRTSHCQHKPKLGFTALRNSGGKGNLHKLLMY